MSWSEQVQPLLPSSLELLVAIMVERLPEWCTEEDEDPPILRFVWFLFYQFSNKSKGKKEEIHPKEIMMRPNNAL